MTTIKRYLPHYFSSLYKCLFLVVLISMPFLVKAQPWQLISPSPRNTPVSSSAPAECDHKPKGQSVAKFGTCQGCKITMDLIVIPLQF